jgi:hypothetical protein
VQQRCDFFVGTDGDEFSVAWYLHVACLDIDGCGR